MQKILLGRRNNIYVQHGAKSDPAYSPDFFAEIIASSGATEYIETQYQNNGHPWALDAGKAYNDEIDNDVIAAINALKERAVSIRLACADLAKCNSRDVVPILTRKPGDKLVVLHPIQFKEVAGAGSQYQIVDLGPGNDHRLWLIEFAVESSTFDVQLHRLDEDEHASDDKFQPFRGLTPGKHVLKFHSLDLQKFCIAFYNKANSIGRISAVEIAEAPQPGNFPDMLDMPGFYAYRGWDKNSYLYTGTPGFSVEYPGLEYQSLRVRALWERFVNLPPSGFYAKTEEPLSMYWTPDEQRQYPNAASQYARMVSALANYQYSLTGKPLLIEGDAFNHMHNARQFTRSINPLRGGMLNSLDHISPDAPIIFMLWYTGTPQQMHEGISRFIAGGYQWIPAIDITNPHLDQWEECLANIEEIDTINGVCVYDGAGRENEWTFLPEYTNRARTIFNHFGT